MVAAVEDFDLACWFSVHVVSGLGMWIGELWGGGGVGRGLGGYLGIREEGGRRHTLYDIQGAAVVAFLVGELVHFAAAFDVEH